ncbi:hypothetical protein CLIB1444_02S06150 [[Candida] jaroonii]|uniref:Uncharacterized protein n=1 Tax=[Candida] jaroonii TaxID=467808 RepID=A0ACA9Y3D7_9ASCO|nr:hypothetical protein CLIB1444_02S06150 [[Candida] jaroonii]
MKCDEQLPICQNCIKSHRKCYRGVRLNFIQYSFYDPKNQYTTKNFEILDQSITIAKIYNGKRFYKPYLKLHTKEDLEKSDEIFQRDNEIAGNFQIDDDKREKLIGSISGTTSAAAATRATAAIRETMVETITSNYDGNSNGNYEKFDLPHKEDIPKDHNDLTSSELPQSSMEDIHGNRVNRDNDSSKDDFFDKFDEFWTESSNFLNEENINNFNFNPVENFSISNFLLKPKYQIKLPNNLKNSKLIFDNPNFQFNIKAFIKLIDSEKYYWLLDLFNDLDIWKNLIPNYCLHLINEGDDNENNNMVNGTFLINCLLNCSKDNIRDGTDFQILLNHQLHYYESIKNKIVSVENFKIFEILLVSIVLFLFNILNKFILKIADEKVINIFNNQIKLFNKLVFKFFKLSNLKYKKFKSIIFLSSVQSIMILKYLIVKNFELQPELTQDLDQVSHPIDNKSSTTTDSKSLTEHSDPHRQTNIDDSLENIDSLNWTEDLNEEINYETNDKQIIKKLNYFEVVNLNNNFNNLEFNQVNPINHSINSTTSTSFKLRKILVHSIKLDYMKRFPNFKTFSIDNSIIPKFNMINIHVVLPNDKLTLLLLISQYLLKSLSHSLESFGTLEKSFKIIETSMVTEDIKILWHHYFHWMLV